MLPLRGRSKRVERSSSRILVLSRWVLPSKARAVASILHRMSSWSPVLLVEVTLMNRDKKGFKRGKKLD